MENKSRLNTVLLVIIILLIICIGYLLLNNSKKQVQTNVSIVDSSSNVQNTNSDKNLNKNTTNTEKTYTTDLKKYTNNKYGFSVQYPNDYKISETNNDGFYNELNIFGLHISVPIGYQSGTDFSVASIEITVSPTTDKCYSSQGDTNQDMTAIKTIGGKSFHYNPGQPIDDSAMGGQRSSISLFSTINNGQCYRIEKLIGYRDPRGFSEPPYPPHFDQQKANTDLDKIISSIIFN